MNLKVSLFPPDFLPAPKLRYACIDVETTLLRDGVVPRTKFWGYADEEGYKRFKTTADLQKFLSTQPETVLLHHNDFDVIQALVDGASPISITKSHGGKLIQCLWGKHTLQNTLKVYPESLAKILAAFGYKKKKLADLAARNYSDCVEGLDCFLKLNQIFFDLVRVHPLEVGTVAGTTFKAAERIAGKMPKHTEHIEAYRGGRTEAFHVCTCEDTENPKCAHWKPANNFDIHSSYPQSFIECKPRETLMRVRVNSKDWHGPLFADGIDDMLLFPNGDFYSWVFQSNFERYIQPYAEKTRVKVIERLKIDCSWLCALQGLVNELYDRKAAEQGNAIATVCKYLLNAFYGRIGLKPLSERCRIMREIPPGDTESWKIGRSQWLVFDVIERQCRSNYPFAAFITDNARARLYEAFKLTNPLYGDTDSVFTSLPQCRFPLPTGPALGQWAFEARRPFKAHNVKDYIFGDEEVLKGGRGGIAWTIKRFAEGKGALEVTRERKTRLRKRRVDPDGTTFPLEVETT